MIALAYARRLHGGAAVFAAAAAIAGASMMIAAWGGPSAGAPPLIGRLPPGYSTALYRLTQGEAETEQAWSQLAAAFELVRSSRESVTQAEALRGTAARLAQVSRENVAARKTESDPGALESARYQQVIAESQLALAEELLAKARKMSESAAVILEIARQNASRLQGSEESRDPADDTRSSDPFDLFKIGRPPDAARRSRRA